jgi:hypothetical protein
MHVFSPTAPDIALGLLGLLSVWGVFALCTLVLAKLEWPSPARPERGREQPLPPSVPLLKRLQGRMTSATWCGLSSGSGAQQLYHELPERHPKSPGGNAETTSQLSH